LAGAQAAAPETGSASSPKAAAAKLELATVEELKAEFDNVPCKEKERLPAVKALFERMGAPPAALGVNKLGGVENLVVVKPGRVNEKIVIGAHYDRAGNGSCGALDNWTGIVVIAHIYQALKDVPLNKTLVFVAFGREEQGLVGSRAMANAISNAKETEQYCAMINIDSLGMALPQVADNMSSKQLLQAAAELARKLELPFAHAEIIGGDSDSSSFVKKKIPAVTIHGMSSDWQQILHSRNDQAERVNQTSVYLGYRLALALVGRVDDAECQAFREVKQ
jgi:Zn-dependent M28 family amino/carboxypeptidase